MALNDLLTQQEDVELALMDHETPLLKQFEEFMQSKEVQDIWNKVHQFHNTLSPDSQQSSTIQLINGINLARGMTKGRLSHFDHRREHIKSTRAERNKPMTDFEVK